MRVSLVLLLFISAFWNNSGFSRSYNESGKDRVRLNDSLKSMIFYGQKVLDNKDYETAIQVFNKALKIASKNDLSADASFIYKKIGGIYYSQQKFSKSKENYFKSVHSDSLSKNAADSHFNLSLIYSNEKSKDSTIYHLKKSLTLYDMFEDSKAKFNTYRKAGIILKNNGHYDLSLRYLIRAYEGFDLYKDSEMKANVCNSIASVQRLLGNLDIAKEYYLEALDLRTGLEDSLQFSFAYNNLANLYKALKKYDSATILYKKAIDFQKNNTKSKDLGKSYYNLATVEYILGKLPDSEKNYNLSLEIKKFEKDSGSFAASYNELALIAIDRKYPILARKYLDSVSLFINPNQENDVLLRNYQVKSSYYTLVEDYKNALIYNQKHIDLYKNLFNARQASAIQALQERFESKKKLLEIERLMEGNSAQKEVISDQKKNIQLLLILSITIVLLTLVIYFFLRQRQRVREKEFEIQRLSSIFNSQELLKGRISKDLHDIITTSYDGIRLKILALSKAKTPEKIGEQIASEIIAVNNEIRLISHRISPLGNRIKKDPLRKIILNHLTEFQFYRKIFVNIQLPLPKYLDSFNLETQTNFYGIILEALNNIEKHSKATEVIIRHSIESGVLEFVIEDNGIGFQDKSGLGVGIINMKQRAEIVNGECFIDSLDTGTKITVKIPIKLNLK